MAKLGLRRATWEVIGGILALWWSLGGLGGRVGHLVSHLGGSGVVLRTVVGANWAQK